MTKAYERLGFRALGYFVVYLNGNRFGVYEPEASFLACAYDEIGDRIGRRGRHVVPFLSEYAAEQIAEALNIAFETRDEFRAEPWELLGIPTSELREFVNTELFLSCVWDRGYDRVFDDGTRLLHFDVGDRVRLIGYKPVLADGDFHCAPNSLQEVWLSSDAFYETLTCWRDRFHHEWLATAKISTVADGAGG